MENITSGKEELFPIEGGEFLLRKIQMVKENRIDGL